MTRPAHITPSKQTRINPPAPITPITTQRRLPAEGKQHTRGWAQEHQPPGAATPAHPSSLFGRPERSSSINTVARLPRRTPRSLGAGRWQAKATEPTKRPGATLLLSLATPTSRREARGTGASGRAKADASAQQASAAAPRLACTHLRARRARRSSAALAAFPPKKGFAPCTADCILLPYSR